MTMIVIIKVMLTIEMAVIDSSIEVAVEARLKSIFIE